MPSTSAVRGAQAIRHSPNARRPAAQGLAKVLFLVLAQVSHASAAPLRQFFGLAKEEPKDAEEASLWLYLAVAGVLVLLGGAFAGLTIA